MTSNRRTITRAAAALLCSTLILVTWAQSRRVPQGASRPYLPAGATANALSPRPQSQSTAAGIPAVSGALFNLSQTYDVTPLRGLADVVTGDFNGDGKLDMAVVNPCNMAIPACPGNGASGWIAVLLGNGDGTFAPPMLYSSGTFYPDALVTGDFNRDGHTDLAFSSQCLSYDNCATGALSVMLGNGDGTFQAPVTYATAGSQTNSLAAGDVNGDGILDLVSADVVAPGGTGGSASVFIGRGDGTFGTAASYGSGGAVTVGVAVADFSGDGVADIALTNINGYSVPGSVGVLTGNGDGTFGPAVPYLSGGYVPNGMTATDVNRDGVPDLVVANACANAACASGGSVGVLIGNGDGTFHQTVPYASAGSNSVAVAAGDFNGDGSADLAVSNESPGSVTVLLGNGNGTFQSALTFSPGGMRTDGVAIGDFNGDGRPDLAVANGVSSDNPTVNSSVGVLLNGALGFAVHPTTTGVTAAANPVGTGQAVLLTATVTALAPAPAVGGSVTFYDGGSSLGTASVVSGHATLMASFTPACMHPVQARYSGDVTHGPSVSAILREIAGTPVGLTSSPNPSVLGQTVTLTATVAGASGSVTFTDGANTLGTSALVNGSATFVASTLPAGIQALKASYSGSLPAGLGKLSQTVVLPTTMALSSSAEVVQVNSPITFTANVTGQNGPPSGFVVFTQGSTLLAATFISSGQASYTTQFIDSGVYPITATYLGDRHNQSSISSVLNQGVASSLPAPSRIEVASSGSPSAANSPITFTATVTSKYGPIPNGETVTFSDAATVIGTGTTLGGVATYGTSSLAVGLHSITATYAGDALFATSSHTTNQNVKGEPVVVVVSSGLTPAYVGQPVTLSATLTAQYGRIPDGEPVTFQNGATAIGTAKTTSGGASINTTFPAVGNQFITASYVGDASFLPSKSDSFKQVIRATPTTTLVSSALSPAYAGQSVTFSAAVSAAFGAVPDGETVTFQDGAAVIGTSSTLSGMATLSTTFPAVGNHFITAAYSGDAIFLTSTSPSFKQIVKGTPTRIAVSSSLNPAYVGQGTTLSATITAAFGAVPDGETITFLNGGNAIGTGLTVGGVTTFNATFAAVGNQPITANYAGDGIFLASASPSLKQIVKAIPTTVAITSSTNPAFVNQAVTFSATVSATFGTVPDGETVTFRNGPIVLGTGATASGVATFTTSALAAATHNVTAGYAGDAAFLASASPALPQLVKKSPTSTVVVSAQNPAFAGQSLTLSATITAQFGAVPDGETVTFKSAGAVLGMGTTAGSVAILNTSFVSVGNEPVIAVYAGDLALLASTSPTIKQIVKADPTRTLVTSSQNPAYVGQSLTLSATVSSLYGAIPDGETVTFKSGPSVIGTGTTAGGVATLSTSFSAPGTLSLSAGYAGDGRFLPGNSPSFQLVVKKNSSTVVLTSSQNPAFTGQAITFSASVAVPFGAVPDGETVTFKNGPAVLGTGLTAGGVATLSTSFVYAGTDSIIAAYPGDTTYLAGTSAPLPEVIKKSPTTTVVISSQNPAFVSQPLTFTAMVSAQFGAALDGETVTFYDGKSTLGTGTTAGGAATLAFTFTAPGSHSITAFYAGDRSLAASASAPLKEAIDTNSTVTTLASSMNPSFVGQAVTFSAAVAPKFGAVPDGETVTFKTGPNVLGTGTTLAGVAVFTTSAFAAATHSVTAVYPGDGTFLGSASAALQQTVKKSPTTTAISASQNPAYAGQPVTLTATVTAQFGPVPDGETVTFRGGAVVLGTGTTAAGTATASTTFTSAGNQSITATYGGDGAYLASTSPALKETIKTDSTGIALTSNLNPAYVGQAVTLTATSSAQYGVVPDGETVTFEAGSTVVGTGLTASGVATFTTSSLVAATHYIAASYAGDGVFLPSKSAVLSQVVKKRTTSTVVSSSQNPAAIGQPVTLSATIAAQFGAVPDGETVTFLSGKTVLGTGETAGGVATLSASFPAPGTLSITAFYAGDTAYLASTSAALPQVVKKDSTTTALSSSQNPAVVGQPATLTAVTTAPFAAVPDGETITFKNGPNVLGTGTTVGGTATLTVSFSVTGKLSLTAAYAGDTTLLASTSASLKEVINANSTSIALGSTVNPSFVGQAVTFSAAISAKYGTVPDGETVTFLGGTNVLGTGATAGGLATFTTSTLAPTTHNVTATYPGDSTYTASTSNTVKQVVTINPTSVALTSTPNPGSSGHPVIFTAVVTSNGPAPTGTVKFLNGTSIMGNPKVGSGGVATLKTSSLAVGSYSITASYSGDTASAPSTSAVLTQVIQDSSTVTTVVSGTNPSVAGQPVTLTATVAPVFGTIPDGETVTFTAGPKTLGSGLTAGGVATLSTAFPSVGNHVVTATYTGDSTYSTSTSAAVKQVVKSDATTTTLTASLNPAIVAQPVTFSATVSAPFDAIPDGETVTFKSGATVLGTGLTAGGIATLTTSYAAAGNQTITANYPGDATNLASVSAALKEGVKANSTTTVLTSSQNPSYIGQTVTFTATVTAAGGSVPDGETVTFDGGSKPLGSGLTVGGVATFTTSALLVSTHSLTASYPGDGTYPGSTSATLKQVVTVAPTSIALASSANPSVWGQPVIFTAIVSSPGPMPTGTVNFLNGGIKMGSGKLDGTGTATFITSSLAPGTYSITAQYGGSSVSGASVSSALSQVVNQAATSTMVVSSANPSVSGQPVTFTATVTTAGGNPTGSVTFAANAVPLATVPLTGGQAAFMTSALASGQYTITATYSGDTNFTGSATSLAQTVN